jgi:chloramphenicol-sensitive protein RarD
MAGIWYGLAAYSLWGFFTLYWSLLPNVRALEVVCHRIVWAFVLLAAIGARSWRTRGVSVPPRVVGLYGAAALLIGVNWFLYVYAVSAGLVVESSLGYFITPLVNVLLGVAVFRERLRLLQWAAVLLALGGVVRLTTAYGAIPWIALCLAFSFGSYGLVKKKAPLSSLDGLTLETAVLVLPAALYLAVVQSTGTGAFLVSGAFTSLLLVGAGVITVGPLLLFATAVRRVPLSVIGILQYISPTIQFLLGVFFFREPFTSAQLSGFILVWVGLVVFGVDGALARKTTRDLAVLDGGAI